MQQVWEIETGELVYTITQAHGTKASYITAMVTDDTGHQLITAACDGKSEFEHCHNLAFFIKSQTIEFFAC